MVTHLVEIEPRKGHFDRNHFSSAEEGPTLGAETVKNKNKIK